MFSDQDQIQQLRSVARTTPVIKEVRGIRVDRNALPEEVLERQPDYYTIRNPIYYTKDVTSDNTHLISQNAPNSLKKSQAFTEFRTEKMFHTIPKGLPIPVYNFTASDLGKYTGLFLKEANGVFKGSFGKDADYVSFYKLTIGEKAESIDDKFAVNWGTWHEAVAIERIRAKFNIKIYKVGMKRMCICPELGLYLTATPDFLFEFKDIEGLMGTGEAKSRSPIIETDSGYIIQLTDEQCIPYDPMKYLHAMQANSQAALFGFLFYM
jgi:hypothetical protein